MKTKNLFQKMILALGRLMPGVIFLLLTRQAGANPTGLTVQSGAASATASGSRLTVTAGNNAVLNWQSFNIAPGETTVFSQPSAASVVWNRVNSPNPSEIYGTLQANGIVVLLNSSGFYFGPNSFVSAAGLVVSTANCTPPENTGGGSWEFNGPPPLASIVNYGEIKIGQSGSCYLIAEDVENHGDIETPGGSIGLAAGQTVTLSERPDGRGMGMKVTLPQGSVDNYGTLLADAGTISLNAQVVNQNGFIQANSVQNVNGVIELVAGDQLNLGASSQISAQGDSSAGGSAGGSVTLKSDNSFSDATGSEISVAGGANGGDGGTVEISAPVMSAIHSTIDGTAKAGFTGGKLLLDPDYIILDTSGPDSAGSGTVTAGSDPNGTGTLDLNVDSAFTGFSLIDLQANYDITLADNTAWDLSQSTGVTSGQLILEAGRNIIFGNQTSLTDENNWSVGLYAGVSSFGLNPTVAPGAGSIYMNASDPNNPNESPSNPDGFLQTSAGNITMVAGQDITVGTGYVTTTGGGNITAHALAGNIDTGGYAQGYVFQTASSASGGYYVDGGLGVGGISTIAGGDVNLTAGGDVQSILPADNGYYYDGSFVRTGPDANVVTAGAGAYGTQPGDVTIIAGGDVTGNYVVANGTGTIYAGVQMDANGNPVKDGSGNFALNGTGNAGTSSDNLALNLVSGGWNVTAAQDIYLQEVRNPNGDFNTVVSSGSPTDAYHAFDYAPSDYVDLTAGNLVRLGAPTSALPRLNGLDSLRVPMIFPGILDVSAGAGGVVLDGDSTYNQLILYPSPLGSLVIDTTGGGSLTSTLPAVSGAPQVFNLIVSDSGNDQYTSSSGGLFGVNDHASTPVHENSEQPVELNISGDMDLVMLASPEAAQINVVGDMYNCRFQGMNLSSSDVTSITVGEQAKVNMEDSGILNPATDGSLTVGGDIYDRSAFTSVVLDSTETAPNLAELADAYGNTVDGVSITAETLLSSLFYTPASGSSGGGTLTYQNIPRVNLSDLLSLLQNLTVTTGEVDSSGNPITKTVSVISAATVTALLNEYNALNSQIGAIPSGTGGFTMGGGGAFDVTAANMDLGTSTGIQSKGIGLYQVNSQYPLAKYFSKGSSINIDLTGDLTMYSSDIASLNGGDISIYAGGSVNVGSTDFTVTAEGARGIFTTDQGSVSVIADGDIDVNGSRIAAYDGGDVTVESLDGDIDAGSGGAGFVVVNSFSIDPKTGAVDANSPTIPGSGILATTFPDDNTVVGNVLVETPNGNIVASSGGIIQSPLNNAKDNSQAVVDVLAGYELEDSSGNPVSAADIGSGTAVKISDDRDIDASGSGIIGENVDGEATGTFKGVVFGQGKVDLTAPQFTGLTVLGEQVTATGNLGAGDELIGTESVSTSGGDSGATVLSQNANGGGSTFAQGTTANATSSAASSSDTASATAAATQTDYNPDDNDPTKKRKQIALARKVSRVTVLLPGQN